MWTQRRAHRRTQWIWRVSVDVHCLILLTFCLNIYFGTKIHRQRIDTIVYSVRADANAKHTHTHQYNIFLRVVFSLSQIRCSLVQSWEINIINVRRTDKQLTGQEAHNSIVQIKLYPSAIFTTMMLLFTKERQMFTK